MPDETSSYLAGFAARTADTRICTVVARVEDGLWEVKTVDTGATEYASSHATDNYRIRQRVEVLFPNGAHNVSGSVATILTRAPVGQQGLSDSTPLYERITRPAPAMIISVDPDPLILEAGGEPGEQTIIGVAFTGAATYASPTDGDPPNLTNDEAPTVTATKVVMTISADADSPIGSFDVVVSGARSKGALMVKPFVPLESYLFGWSGWPKLLQINPDTLELIGAFEAPEGNERAIGRIGSLVIAMTHDSGVPKNIIHPFDLVTNEMGDPIDTAECSSFCSATVGSELWMPHQLGAKIVRYQADGTSSELAAPATFAAVPSLVGDAVAVYMSDRDSSNAHGGNIWRYDIAAETSITAALPVGIPESLDTPIALTADAVWLLPGSNRLIKIDRDTLAAVLNIGLVASDAMAIATVGAELFVCRVFGGDAHVYVVDQSTADLAEIAVVPDFSVPSMRGGNGVLFLSESGSGKIARVEVASPFTVTVAAVDPDAVGISTLFVT